jgi:hypothetical protein
LLKGRNVEKGRVEGEVSLGQDLQESNRAGGGNGTGSFPIKRSTKMRGARKRVTAGWSDSEALR